MRPGVLRAVRTTSGRPYATPPLLSVLAACVALPLAAAGCSLPLISFQAKEVVQDEPASTGSVRARPRTFGPELGDEDWRRASAALAVALDPQGNGRPVKWDNPETGLRGAINPTGLPFVRNDEICRGFLASVVSPDASRFLRGTGCRPSGGAWELKSVRAARNEG